MDKKRKRASFSAPKAEAIKPVVKRSEEEPVVKQVVEVVVEESKHGKVAPSTQVNIMLPEVDGIDDKPRVKRGDKGKREKEAEEREEELIAVVEEAEEDVEDMIEEQEEESPRHTHKVEVVADEASQDADEEGEDQKEAVAELFGKNSSSILPEITVHKKGKARGVVLWGITMIAVAIGVGGGLVVFSRRGSNPPSPISQVSPSSTPSPTAMVTPTPQAVEREELKVQVLNGGGTPGAGSKMKAFLEEKGYDVVEVKNANAYTYQETEIVIKESKAGNLSMIKDDLSEEYEVGTTDTTLSESSSHDVEVIVGKR